MSGGSGPDTEAAAEPELIEGSQELSNWLGNIANEGQIVQTHLKASSRVIARVTDGIYRQPASALRELISNAWDADANNVTILTDAPRFSRINVRDDGQGMSYETLARLVHAIGGSAKRNEEGQKLGVTSATDPDRTPNGRPLIGKIGIGLFSVSQLASSFRIITKATGTNYRLTAEVRLRTYAEDRDHNTEEDDDDKFISGDVFIIREQTDETAAHGTDIIIENIKPLVRDLLRSASRWRDLSVKQKALEVSDRDTLATLRVEEPKYHVGWIENLVPSSDSPAILAIPPRLPWGNQDSSSVRMSRLMDAVEREFSRTERPDLETTLDTYLATLWRLSLSVPVGYVDKHPFDLTGESGIQLYWLSNDARGPAIAVPLERQQTVRQAVEQNIASAPKLEDGLPTESPFRVTIDGFELKRPIRFKFYSTSSRGLDKAMLFVGRYSPNLSTINRLQRGGNLSFESYLFWSGRIIPKENNGVIIRIRGASGSLFDPTFFNYQISEQTRLKQISSELFIKSGVDAALNIDRESFNYSHPHIVLLTSWFHRALRQLTNQHKELGQRLLQGRRTIVERTTATRLATHTEEVWRAQQGSEISPDVVIVEGEDEADAARQRGAIALRRSALPSLAIGGPQAASSGMERRAQALVKVLAAFKLLEDRPYIEQQRIVDAILRVFFLDAES